MEKDLDLRSSRWRPTADQVAERVRILGSLQPRLRGSAFVIADPARYGTFCDVPCTWGSTGTH